MGRPEQALEPTKSAVAADPSDGYAQRNLGALLLGLGQVNEALAHLRAARSAMPHDPQTTFGLAAALEVSASAENLAESDELYQVVVQRWPASKVAEQARQARTKLAHRSMRSNAVGGLRPDVVMYITDAFKILAEAGPTKSQQIGLEIALKGQGGLDINDADKKYTLITLPGQFSGLQLVSIMYAAVKQADPTADVGIDLDAEYQVALAMKC
jgi:tetratricopeptide (TPR) repeat protein